MSKNNGFQLTRNTRPPSLRRRPTHEEKATLADFNRQELAIRIEGASGGTAAWVITQLAHIVDSAGLKVSEAADFVDEKAEASLSPEQLERFRSCLSDPAQAQAYYALLKTQAVVNENIYDVVGHGPPLQPISEEVLGIARRFTKAIW